MMNLSAELAETTEANAKLNPVQQVSDQTTVQNVALHCRYRQIGISAVAAAVRYQGIGKNPAYARTETDWRRFADEAAA